MATLLRPLFGFGDLLRDGTIIGEDTLAGFPLSNALDGRTTSQAGFEGNGTAKIQTVDLGSAMAFDFVAMARHNLSNASTVNIQGSNDNILYTPISSLAPISDDKPFIVQLGAQSYRYVRLIFVSPTEDLYVSDITVGEIFQWPIEQPTGFTIPRWSDNDEVSPNRTRGGELAGLSIITKPKTASISLRFQEISFFDTSWDNFVSNIKRYPFYFMWTESRPDEVMFGWLPKGQSVPKPSYSNTTLLRTSFNMEGFA